MWSLAPLLLLLGSLAAVEAQAQCYYAAGKKALDQYIPCGGGSGISACCLAGDFCLEDGACYGPDTKMTYIAGCTDPTFGDDSCKGGSGTCNKDTQFQGLALCGNNWVCCQGDGQSGQIPTNQYSNNCACDAGFGTAIANVASLPGTQSLGTAFPTHASAAATSSSSSAAATTTSSQHSSAAKSNSATPSTTFSTIPLSISNGISGTGSGAAAATSAGGATSGSSGPSQSTKIGLGVGIPLGVAALAAVAVAGFCFRKRILNREPKYVTQADLSTPVWVGEAPGSGGPAPRDPNAYSSNTSAGAAGAAGGWKANERTSQMSEVGTPPPQYQNHPGQSNGAERPNSQGIWQPQRLQALQ